ncbi:hypothetical protein [Xanthomonas oryzae]|uniref:Uncharacterized protein n=1 Tax=Xanthomonas oryzae pv. leersiae TaxID=3112258 RepID=A0AAJ6H085_9XANT|nr:hypothetical protein [Xanthomonas oryzae]UNE62178.1 hypothetical protein MML47_18385 [Xanthomonas oryzae]UWI56373.1 hypothetical protein NO430_17830 [Xanthomonas oryzae pv. oryzae]WIX06101.1 hypothetical protein QN060_18635 [Xanthomonas oryzae pv. oryzae]
MAGTGPTTRQHINPPASLCVDSDACAMSAVRCDALLPIPNSRFPIPGPTV